MEHVFQCEDALVACRDDKEGTENELNEADAAFQDFKEQQEAERAEQKEIVKKWFKAVAGIEARSRELQKKIIASKGTLRYEKMSLKRAEENHQDMEQRSAHEVAKIRTSKENLKTQRLKLMRKSRDIEDMELEFERVLTPIPGQQGAQGILAHKRLLEMEAEFELRSGEHEAQMKQLEAALATIDDDEKACEEQLDDALFQLGEECYAERVADPALAAFYPRLDKAK